MSGFALDLRYAWRSLRKSPGYTALCLTALALGIGANGAIFSLVETVMLRPLPYPEPDRLMVAHMTIEGGPSAADSPEIVTWSHPKLQAFLGAQRAFSAVGAFADESVNLTGGGEPERLQIEIVTPGYFSVLGVEPVLGRGLTAADDAADAPLVAVVSEGLWQRRFGGSTDIVDRTLQIDKALVTVVGVLPRGFAGLTGQAELWIPTAVTRTLWYPEALDEPHNHWLQAVARLRPGMTPEAAGADMQRVGAVVRAAVPFPEEMADGSVWSAGATSLVEARQDPFMRRALVVLLVAVVAVLLIACANLAGLALVRAGRRQRELAIRRAIGASRSRLVRQALAESLLLAVVGGVAGVVAATWIVRALSSLRPEALGTWGIGSTELGDLAAAGVGLPVVLFCLATAAGAALLVGLLPALGAGQAEPGAGLRLGAAAVTGHSGLAGGPAGRGRGLLVAGQTALALVMLVGAGLLLRSLWALQSVDVGVDHESVLTFALTPAPGTYDGETAPLFHSQLVEKLQAVPGVSSVGLGSCLPASGEAGCNSTRVLTVEGTELPASTAPSIGWHLVSSDYFRTLGVPLLAGRSFDGRDREGSTPVVILNETAARRLFPGKDAVGRRLQVGTMGLNGDVHAEVVGVVGDVRYRRLDEEPWLELFIPDNQVTLARTTVYLRTEGDPVAVIPAVREAVRAVDPRQPIWRIRTLEEQLGFALSRARFSSLLLAAFGLVALALAALGVYGVLAQAVTARRREIGLRIALGAAAGEVERLILRQGMRYAVAGAAVGLALALGASGLLRGLLFEVPSRDPVTFVAVPIALLGAALLACLLPARRAARLDPTIVLRQE
jgi:putative ABC transport system permease protein